MPEPISVVVCAWCGKWKAPEGWRPQPPQGKVTHGICPECFEAEAAGLVKVQTELAKAG